MSRVKRTFTPEQKAKIVLEAIKGEKQINQLATENNIQPNLIRNWKKEFLEHASLVFDEKRDENIRDKLDETRKEKDAYARKVGCFLMCMVFSLLHTSKVRNNTWWR